MGLNKIVVHEVDGHIGVGFHLPLYVSFLLLLHEGLLFLLGLSGSFGLGFDGVLVDHRVI